MTDAHFHRNGTTFASLDPDEFRFCGVHPWDAEKVDPAAETERLRSMLAADTSLGVGEIGLDRLKSKIVSSRQREVFAAQLALAAEAVRPVVLHGAKCWGEVVRMLKPFAGKIPAFLFHGFSRSDGLLADIVAVNGFVGVGKAVLNDHAVNYRELVKRIPHDRIVVETDCDGCTEEERASVLKAVTAKVAKLASVAEADLACNVAAFLGIPRDGVRT
jgi:TatD DNase family protein